MWTELGHAQLDNGAVGDAIASYLRRCVRAVPGPRARVMAPRCRCAMLQHVTLSMPASRHSSYVTPREPGCLHE